MKEPISKLELPFKHKSFPDIIFLPLDISIRAININATDCPLQFTINSHGGYSPYEIGETKEYKYTLKALVESENWKIIEKILNLIGKLEENEEEYWGRFE